jgi:uncharacterized phosphosugar-binding protein
VTPGRTTAASAPAGQRYLRNVSGLLERLECEQWDRIDEGAGLIADALAAGHTLHAFGSGHSHMLAEELYYRAGGLVRVRPILFEGLMLHASATLSTTLERVPGLAAALIADHGVAADDVLLIASNSGSNAVVIEMAEEARRRGLRVVAITSVEHANSEDARQGQGPRLHELADVAIDNGGVVGDASVDLAGLPGRVAPTSTVVGAAIVNTLVAEVAERLLARGTTPEVFTSANVAGGDDHNAAHLSRTARR